MSLRNCLELWGHAKNLDELHCVLKQYPQYHTTPYFKPDKSFKIEVETFCKHFTQKEKVEKIEVGLLHSHSVNVLSYIRFFCGDS